MGLMLLTFFSITFVAGCHIVLDKVGKPRPIEVLLDKFEGLVIVKVAHNLGVMSTLKDIQFELL